MKKSFPLVSERHKPDRLIEQIKGQINKYLKRERRKELPEGSDYWDFDCRAGASAEEAREVHLKELGAAIEQAMHDERECVYLEIVARPARRRGSRDQK